jgi:hypothetical protein
MCGTKAATRVVQRMTTSPMQTTLKQRGARNVYGRAGRLNRRKALLGRERSLIIPLKHGAEKATGQISTRSEV